MADGAGNRPLNGSSNSQARGGDALVPAQGGGAPLSFANLQKIALAELALRSPKGFVGGGGPVLTTGDAQPRPFVEVALLFGQAVGGGRPIQRALVNLQAQGRDHNCDAVVSVELLEYQVNVGTVIVAYGTGIKYLDLPVPAAQ